MKFKVFKKIEGVTICDWWTADANVNTFDEFEAHVFDTESPADMAEMNEWFEKDRYMIKVVI